MKDNRYLCYWILSIGNIIIGMLIIKKFSTQTLQSIFILTVLYWTAVIWVMSRQNKLKEAGK